MAALKMRVSQILIIAVALALLGLPYLFLYQKPSVQHMLTNFNSSILQPHNHLIVGEHNKELQYILSRAAMPNKTVIITTLNEAWAAKGTMIDLFLLSFRRGKDIEHLLEHLVIVTLDRKAHERCLLLHPYCFRLETEGVDFAGEKSFMSEDYLKMMWRRIRFLGDVLEMGYSFVFSDADILWFRDPFPNFADDSDFQIACDKYVGGPFDVRMNAPNGGFIFVRSNTHTIAMYRYWYAARLRVPGKHDQDVLSVVLHEKGFGRLGVKIRFLEPLYFSGFCQMSKDLKRVVTIHANCCKGGLSNKLKDLQLALDDWRSYNGLLPSNQDTRSNSAKHWRVPLSCRRSKWMWWRRHKLL